MKKIVIFSCAIALLVGLYLMYSGYYMAQGNFMGVSYVRDDYTNFNIGMVLGIVGLLALLVSLFGFSSFNVRLSNSFNFGSIFSVPIIIRVFSLFGILISLLFLIIGIVNEESYVLVSFIGFISSLCMLGFSYIVEAACLYIERAERERAEKLDAEE